MRRLRLPSDRILADYLQDGVILLDKKQRVIWWNTAAVDLLELEDKQHMRQPAQTVFSEWELEPALARLQIDAENAEPYTSVHGHISLTLRPYQDQQVLLLARDIAHLRHLEHMRQDFVANVSHELRTPLTVMHGYLEVLLDQAKQKEDQVGEKMYQHMLQQSVRMEKIVEDLLRLANLERPQDNSLSHLPVDVASMLHAIHEEAIALSGDKKHEVILDADKGLKIFGDADTLRSAFSNIIFNAVHYTPSEGKIIIRWQHTPKGAEFSVQDTGLGIADKHIHRLTERFYRADKARSRTSGGTGLGLAIVKHILLHHDTQLDIKSVVGRGSTFSCTFPISRIYAG